jgi:hypothetical protein
MPGNLHIFRLQESPLQYQVNYNLGANSWVQVFSPKGLEEFLYHSTGIASDGVEAMLSELREENQTTEPNIDLPESHLGEMGFAETPSDE